MGKPLNWIYRGDEEPGLAQVVVVEVKEPDEGDLPYQTICFGLDDLIDWDWWYPLPPRESTST